MTEAALQEQRRKQRENAATGIAPIREIRDPPGYYPGMRSSDARKRREVNTGASERGEGREKKKKWWRTWCTCVTDY
jgi:hypothetical protein